MSLAGVKVTRLTAKTQLQGGAQIQLKTASGAPQQLTRINAAMQQLHS
ncbi:hypothetical protein [Phyllobacterium bourgognense]|nr:hypothetical protein [Phyllobacterium bourgognense]